ncbi:MAG: molybdate ABC transporter substrate-binding protein [Gammaproteobacteria bacterium]|nr:molybdate ABC transporter substrate-binding protein [Gammaproteobacteria bacterium]
MSVLQFRYWAFVPFVVFVLVSSCKAEDAIVAVASNFLETAKELSKRFDPKKETITLASGSTGQIFAQINQGAPFHVFLSADHQRVDELVKRELAISATQTTYAHGRICFYLASKPKSDETPEQVFDNFQFKRVAIANPRIAPYGKASLEALRNAGWSEHEQKLQVATAQNVGQAFAMVSSGNAETGIVALSTILLRSVDKQNYFLIPTQMHEPIRQDAVLLVKGSENATAKRFLNYLSSNEGKTIIRSHGYNID